MSQLLFHLGPWLVGLLIGDERLPSYVYRDYNICQNRSIPKTTNQDSTECHNKVF